MLQKSEGKRRKGRQRLRWLDSIIDSMDMNLSKLQETEEKRRAWVLQSMELQIVGHDLVTEPQQREFSRSWRIGMRKGL